MTTTDPAATLRRAARLAPTVLPAAIAELVAGEIRFRDSEVLAAEVLALARQQSSSDTCMAFVPDGSESAAPCDRPTVPGTSRCDRHQCNGDWACPAELHDAGCFVLPAELLNAPIHFWQCPIRQHREREEDTVEWRDGVAHCTAPGCDRSSAQTREESEEGGGRAVPGHAGREETPGRREGRGLTCTPSGVAAPMPADGTATPAPLSSRPTIATPVRVYCSETTFVTYRTPGADALIEAYDPGAGSWQTTRWESLEALAAKCGPMTEVQP